MMRMLVLIGLLFATPVTAQTCSETVAYLKGDWGQAKFSVELADTAETRAQGLMHRESMPRSAGMLFVYGQPQSVAFWMYNTLIPLDMIFLDSTGTVQKVHSNAIPHDTTPIPGGDDIQLVLEVNGGLAATYGINAGTQLLHPSVPQQTAIWKCGKENHG